MRKSRYSFSVNLIPFETASRSRRFMGIAGASFFLGAAVAIFGLGSVLGADPLSLMDGGALDTLTTRKTPSERLIAQGSVIDVAKKVQPSIVGIQTQTKKADDVWRERADQREVESVGSGVIMRRDGYILTNDHVIKGASSIIVTVGNDKVPARVIGADPDFDTVVIMINHTALLLA